MGVMGWLAQARRLWWARTVVEGTFSVLTVFSVLTLVVAAWHAAAYRILVWVETGPGLAGAVTSAVLVAFVLACLIASVRVPRLQAMAVMADKRLRLEERVSSVVALHSPGNLVSKALVEEVEEIVGRVRAAAVVPFTLKPRYLVPPVLALIAVGIWPAANGAGGSSPAAEQASQMLGPVEEAAILLRMADLVTKEAVALEDSYLLAIGQAFEALSVRSTAARGERGDLESDVAALLQQLAQAVAGRDLDLNQALVRSGIKPSLDSGQLSDQPFQFTSPGEDQGLAGLSSDDSETPVSSPAREGQEFRADDVFRTLGQIAADLEAPAMGPSLAEASGDVNASGARVDSSAGQSSWYTNIDPELQAQLDARRAALTERLGAGGVPVGAAEQATDAPGDFAGQGTRPLGEGAEGFDVESTDHEDVLLPWGEQEDGRQVEFRPEPDVEYRAASPLAGTVVAGFQRSDEARTSRELIGTANRESISRYFLPDLGR